MNVLFLPHRVPFPPNKGDKIRAYHMLLEMCKEHTVHLACPVGDEEEEGFAGYVRRLVDGEVFTRRVSRRQTAVNVVKSVATLSPLTDGFFYSKQLQKDIDGLLIDQEIDAVVCFSGCMAQYVMRSTSLNVQPRPRLIMDLIDVDSSKWQQYATQANWLMKLVYRYEHQAVSRVETEIQSVFDAVFLTSEAEKKELQTPTPIVKAMTNGVDAEYFSPDPSVDENLTNRSIVFTGAMDYPPNIDAVAWFVAKVFPNIRKHRPDARFIIVGSNPTHQVRRLAETQGVEVTGFVDDVRGYVSQASVVVAPLRVARGIQNKVLEAMAMGKVVVASPEALTGILGAAGKHFISAANAAVFEEEIIRLFNSPDSRATMGQSARLCVLENHSWVAALKVLRLTLGSNTVESS